ncbi:MAG: hypothetical protein IIU70_00745 [Anaerotignum sp.]|nr:hypothetical protein [Anaerotignum sp.]
MIHLKQLFTTEKQFPEKRLSIAFLDTGISPVEDFTYPQNRILVFRDLINGKTKPYDDNGHGTHVTGSAIKEKRAHYYQKGHRISYFRRHNFYRYICTYGCIFCRKGYME